MPVRSKASAEARYNVTTEFVNFNLHVASAAGNLGLVRYALDKGQPVNSVLDGVLPLHAACSGGDEQCVRVLLDHGADVNAERLPRKYSTTIRGNLPPSSSAATSAIVGASGSTPLHFASANGHTNIVRLLLRRGARANRADKHGVTPEAVARQNGWLETADVLEGWERERDRDLIERSLVGQRSFSDLQSEDPRLPQRKDSMRDSSGPIRTASGFAPIDTSEYPDSNRPLGEYTSYPNTAVPPSPLPPSPGRHPPYDTNTPPPEAMAARRPSLPQIFERNPNPRTRGTPRRPTSAGTGSDRMEEGSLKHKLVSKYSLLNLFKKGDGAPPAPELPYSHSTHSLTSKASLPAMPPPPSPAVGSSSSIAPIPVLAPPPSRPSPTSSPNQSRFRRPSESSSGTTRTFSESSSRPAQAFKQDINNRNRSGSNGSRTGTVFEQDEDDIAAEKESDKPPTTPPRPGILRGHHRTGSSNASRVYPSSGSQGQGPAGASTTSFRALRFDSTADPALEGKPMLSPDAFQTGDTFADRSAELPKSTHSPRPPGSVGSVRSSSRDPSVKRPGSAGSGARVSTKERLRTPKRPGSAGSGLNRSDDLGELCSDFPGPVRPRNYSTTSSSSSLSPNATAYHTSSEFPFSIRNAPSRDADRLLPPKTRTRGDSVSSMSTDGSANPTLSSSATTSNDSNASTAAIATPAAPFFMNGGDVHVRKMSDGSLLSDKSMTAEQGLNGRRMHAPLDINIRTISSHAQAEAMVQKTQRDIFELDGSGSVADVDIAEAPLQSAAGQGWTPLSARLAAYGESLALERRLKKEEEDRANGVPESAPEASEVPSTSDREAEADSEALKILSRTKSAVFVRSPVESGRSIPRAQRQRRPNTANGTSTEKTAVTPRNAHHATLSASAADRLGSIPIQTSTTRLRELEAGMASDLSRASSAESIAPVTPKKREQERIASATKLTRMGFANPESRQTSAPMVVKPRFGLSRLIQTIKGNK